MLKPEISANGVVQCIAICILTCHTLAMFYLGKNVFFSLPNMTAINKLILTSFAEPVKLYTRYGFNSNFGLL